MEKVSIIVPIFNKEDYIESCLDSLLEQTLKDIEIICVNDASTDSSLELVKQRAIDDQRIKIINQKIVDMYLSIHLNYLTDTRYYGAQVFYNKNNEELAKSIQEYLNNNTNTDREVKKIPTSTYMYDKLNTNGVLVECGFLSNATERSKLVTKEYQSKFAKILAQAISHYYN